MTTKTTYRATAEWLVGFIVATGLLLLLRRPIGSSLGWAAAMACLAVVASVLAIANANIGRHVSCGSVYMLLFGLFHAGLLFPIAFGASVRLLSPRDNQWVASPGFNSAAVLVAIAMCGFSIGYFLRHRAKADALAVIDSQDVPDERNDVMDGPGALGITLLVSGVFLWGYTAITSGVAIIGTSYTSFLSQTADTSVGTSYLLIGFGLGVVSASRHRNVRRLALAIFAVWALPAFTLGLRGEVIIPASTFVVVAARRRYIPLRLWMGFAAIGILAAGSAVRVIRQFGVGGSSVGAQAFNPLDGITELGGSIRPLTVVSNFHDFLGEPFVGIATYLSPFRRFIAGRILGGEVSSVVEDPAVFSGMIVRRIGPIGGSPAAEAYRAGGVAGMIFVMILIGVLVAHLDSIASTRLTDAAVGMSMYVLLLWVRNDFTPVPAESAIMAVFLLFLWFSEQRRVRLNPTTIGDSKRLLAAAGGHKVAGRARR